MSRAFSFRSKSITLDEPDVSFVSNSGSLTDDEVISGRFFLRQLCLTDKYFGILAEDYIDAILADNSAQQSVSNWNIIAVCLADHGLMMNDEVMFSIMSGDADVATNLTEDIHALKEVILQGTGSRGYRWKVLASTGQKEQSLKQRLNPFVASRESTKIPTAIYVHDADKLGKTRSLVVAAMKDLETKIARAKEKKSQETRAAEAAAQQKLMEEQMNNINLQKSDMLRLLESLEAKFVADEKRIHQMKRLAGLEVVHSPQPATLVSPRKSPIRIRDDSKQPFQRPTKKR